MAAKQSAQEDQIELSQRVVHSMVLAALRNGEENSFWRTKRFLDDDGLLDDDVEDDFDPEQSLEFFGEGEQE